MINGRVIAFVVILGIVVYVFWAEARKPARPDEDEIRGVLAGLAQTFEKKSVNSGLNLVSRRYMDEGGTNYIRLKAAAIRIFKAPYVYEVSVSEPDVSISGDSAVVRLNAVVSMIPDEMISTVAFSGPVTLFFKKEKMKKWVVLPTHRWRVTESSGVASFFLNE